MLGKNALNSASLFKGNSSMSIFVLPSQKLHVTNNPRAQNNPTANNDNKSLNLNESLSKYIKRFNRSPHYFNEYHQVRDAYTEMGTIQAMPKWYRLGYLKVLLNIVFFIGVGAFISSVTVKMLDENDIFKPEGDDDDDDDD
jgi:hypothetical protein